MTLYNVTYQYTTEVEANSEAEAIAKMHEERLMNDDNGVVFAYDVEEDRKQEAARKAKATAN